MSAEIQSLQAEIDRLRILLQRVTETSKNPKRGFMVEIEPAPSGFRVVATGFTEKDEWRVAEMMADFLNTLLRGSVRWSVKALDEYAKGAGSVDEEGQLKGTLEALHATTDVPLPKLQEPPK